MASAPLYSAAGQPAGETPLEDAIFGAKNPKAEIEVLRSRCTVDV